jgi:hypothetical protein
MRQVSRWRLSADRLTTEASGDARSVSERIDAVLAAESAKRLTMPHIVHLAERASGLASVFGPFGDPVAASSFADRFVADLAEALPSGFVVTVIPLEPPE